MGEPLGETTYRTMTDGPARSAYEGDVQTIPELGAELRSLRYELRTYVERHDREHERLGMASDRQATTLAGEVAQNTTWRTTRQAQESLVKWLVGSNLAVLAGLVLLIIGTIAPTS